jgi:general L-amino acid transport system permease protein
MAVIEMEPPRPHIGPLDWLKKNLFSTWYNALLTILMLWLLFASVPPALNWVFNTAQWGVIKANLTLFMIWQYPREQLWRIWAAIYYLAGLVGLSWGVWKKAARDFAFIALGTALVSALIALLLGLGAWPNWLISAGVLLAFFLFSQRLPRAGLIAGIGWALYFLVVIFLIAGTSWIPGLPFVETNLWGGLLLTIILAVVGIVGSLPLGILLALGRRSKLPIVRLFSIGYIELIRGVPLITILYMADILLPLFLDVNVRPDRVVRAMVGFILFEAAYQAENVRGGLQSIPRGQYEASQALGLSGVLTTVLVILPQAIRAVIPALFNSFISLFKDTSLVAIIGLFDLLRVGRSVLAQPDWLGRHREVFLFAFVVYWLFNLAFSHGSKRIEEALGVGKR